MNILFIFIFFLIILSLTFFLISKSLKKKSKKIKNENQILDGEVIYSDLNKSEKPLISNKYKIIGKPDYIIKNRESYIPVEIKTGRHDTLKKNHIFQIAAYCQILEDYYNCFIPTGIIFYKDTSKKYIVSYDPKLRFELISIINEIRQVQNIKKIKRNHNDIKKCINCSFRKYCNEKIN